MDENRHVIAELDNLQETKQTIRALGGGQYLDYNQLQVQDFWDTFLYFGQRPHWMGMCLMAILDDKECLSFSQICNTLRLTTKQTSRLIRRAVKYQWIQTHQRSYRIDRFNTVFGKQIEAFKDLALKLQEYLAQQWKDGVRRAMTVEECCQFEQGETDPIMWKNQVQCLLHYLTSCQWIRRTRDGLYVY